MHVGLADDIRYMEDEVRHMDVREVIRELAFAASLLDDEYINSRLWLALLKARMYDLERSY